MPQLNSYGDILRDAREKEHMDLNAVARRLRIRPDILRAIEDADFAKMPPRGYTRNMINAYSRLVGLNPHEITELYLDEVYRYESGSPSLGNTASRARSSSSRSTDRSQRRPTRADRNNVLDQRTSRMQRLETTGSSQKRSSRTREPRSRQNSNSENRNNYQRYYSAPANRRSIRDIISPQLLLLIILIAVIIVLVVAIVVAFGANRQESEDIPNVPISGLTDTSDSSLKNTDTLSEESEPTAATVVYEVASGKSSWIELYYDDSSSADFEGEVDGSYTSESISVTGKLLFKTANPEPVTLTVNGEAVELEYDGSEYYTYTIDFPAILAAWQTEHGIVPQENNESDTSESNASENSEYSANDDEDYDLSYDSYDDDYSYYYDDDYDYDYDEDDYYDYDYDYDEDDSYNNDEN